jgi:hypothetical protein
MTDSQKAIATIELTWRHFYVNAVFDRKWLTNVKMHPAISHNYECAVAQLTNIIAGERIKEIRWPLDWWQHLKERWFPKFALKRWPVRYHTFKIDLLYPEIEMRGDFHHTIAIYDSQKSKGYPSWEDRPEELEEEAS